MKIDKLQSSDSNLVETWAAERSVPESTCVFERVAPSKTPPLAQQFAEAFRPARDALAANVIGFLNTIAQLVGNELQAQRIRNNTRQMLCAAEKLKQEREAYEAAMRKAQQELIQVDQALDAASSPEQLDKIIADLLRQAGEGATDRAKQLVIDGTLPRIRAAQQRLKQKLESELVDQARREFEALHSTMRNEAEEHERVQERILSDADAERERNAQHIEDVQRSDAEAAKERSAQKTADSEARMREIAAENESLAEAGGDARSAVGEAQGRELDSRPSARTSIRQTTTRMRATVTQRASRKQ